MNLNINSDDLSISSNCIGNSGDFEMDSDDLRQQRCHNSSDFEMDNGDLGHQQAILREQWRLLHISGDVMVSMGDFEINSGDTDKQWRY